MTSIVKAATKPGAIPSDVRQPPWRRGDEGPPGSLTRAWCVPSLGSIIPFMGMKRRGRQHRGAPSRQGLADALFAKVQQRVLSVLFGNPGRSFYANEVIGLARSGTGAVQRELARLETAGLVTATRIGKQKHYQANRASPVFQELRGLVLKTSGLADVLREALTPTSNRIRAAFVYGSVAKGDDTAGSDIDLMVIAEDLTYGDLFAAIEEAVGIEATGGRREHHELGGRSLRSRLQRSACDVSRRLAARRVSAREPLHRLPGSSAHAGAWLGGVACPGSQLHRPRSTGITRFANSSCVRSTRSAGGPLPGL